MLVLDGPQGEGGGQILRSALALSLVTGCPFRIKRIRAGRARPGLRRQHLAAVNAAVEVGAAAVTGNVLGSQELTFAPREIRAGLHRFAVGSAGSCTLVLQTVLPPLLTADSPSELLLEGGTHNPFAPPFDFLARSFLPLVERMGPRIEATLELAGFYPAGGGRIRVKIEPSPRLAPLELLERGRIVHCRATAMIARLPRHIAERELRTVAEQLGWVENSLEMREIAPAPGPGNVLLLEVESEQVTEIFTGFGERGRPAETVAGRAVAEVQEYLAAGVPVGRHLADQLLLPLALAGGGAFRTLPPTRHTRTNLVVIRQFLPVPVETRETTGGAWEVRIGSARGKIG